MKKLLYLSILNILFLGSCTKQDLKLEVIEKACRNFKIQQPSYSTPLTTDPCSGGTTLSLNVSFTFNDNDDCIHLIKNEPTFYDANNNEITGVSFKESILKSDAEVTVNSESITYKFEAEFADLTDAGNFNHLVLKFHTENETEEASNDLEIRINPSCSVVTSSAFTDNATTVNVVSNTFDITLWDNAAEDGDIVSVYLYKNDTDGEWLIENHTLTNAGNTFIFNGNLSGGTNRLVVFALNEGSSGPNTVSISVNGTEIENFNPGLLTGEAIRINL